MKASLNIASRTLTTTYRKGADAMTITIQTKSIVSRIRYYTHKVNQHSQQSFLYLKRRTNRKPPQTRLARLTAYKKAISEMRL